MNDVVMHALLALMWGSAGYNLARITWIRKQTKRLKAGTARLEEEIAAKMEELASKKWSGWS